MSVHVHGKNIGFRLNFMENTHINGKTVWNLKMCMSILFAVLLASKQQRKKWQRYHNGMQLNANTFANIHAEYSLLR